MIFSVPDSQPQFLAAKTRPESEETDTSLGDTVSASFRIANTIGSAIAQEPRDNGEFDKDYDPFENMEGFEGFADKFIDVRNREDHEAIKTQITRELEDRQILEESGGIGIVSMIAAGLLDPIYLPATFFPAVRGVQVAKAGGSALKQGVKVGAIGGAAEIASEATLQTTQQTRALEESALNVAGATLLSGILGGGVASLSKREFDEVAQRLEQNIAPHGSVGAARSLPQTLDENTLVNFMGLKPLAGKGKDLPLVGERLELFSSNAQGIEVVSPLLRLMNSPANTTRSVISKLVENPLLTRGNLAGKSAGAAVETRIKMRHAQIAQGIEQTRAAFVRMRGGNPKLGRFGVNFNDGFGLIRGEKMGFKEFREEVGKALRRGDEHPIPEVAQVAKWYRRNLFEPTKKKAISLGRLPEDVKPVGAESYLHRVYRVNAIRDGRVGSDGRTFEDVVADWIAEQNPSLERIEAESAARDVANKIMGTPDGRVPEDVIPIAAGLKERTLRIPDADIEEWLESDIQLIADKYSRTMIPELEVMEEFGDRDLKSVIDSINDEYGVLKREARGKSRVINRLEKNRQNDIRDVQAMRDQLYGIFGSPSDPTQFGVRAGRTLRQLNYIRLLGGMTLSSLPDLARPIFNNGFKGYAKGLGLMVKDWKKLRLSQKELKQFGVGLDMVLNSRAQAMADVGDIISGSTRIGRGLQSLSDNFGIPSLMAPWNAAMKQFTGVIVTDNIADAAVRLSRGTLGTKKRALLARSGIDDDMAKRIAQQIEKHGEKDIVYLPNGNNWDDLEALDAFRAAVLKDVDTLIVTPGVSDKPLWTSSELGKFISQFKSFAFAASNRMLLSGLQQRDLNTVMGMLTSIGLGTAVYYTKNFVADREISDDPVTVLAESVDRSGITGYLSDAYNITSKVSGMGPNASRYASRNSLGALLGPSADIAGDVTSLGYAISHDEIKQSDLHGIRKMLPYQNLFYTRKLLNEAEESIAESLGVTE